MKEETRKAIEEAMKQFDAKPSLPRDLLDRISPVPTIDFAKEMKERDDRMAELHEQMRKEKQQYDNTVGVPALNAKIQTMIDFMVETSKSTDSATLQNLKLQTEVRDLTRDLRELTVKLKTFTVILLALAFIQVAPIIVEFVKYTIGVFTK